MQLQEMFDELLIERSIKVYISKQQAESLRTQLAKKWKKYKDSMDACGFLSDDLAACSLGRRSPATDDGSEPYEFLLAPRSKSSIEYQVLVPQLVDVVVPDQSVEQENPQCGSTKKFG